MDKQEYFWSPPTDGILPREPPGSCWQTIRIQCFVYHLKKVITYHWDGYWSAGLISKTVHNIKVWVDGNNVWQKLTGIQRYFLEYRLPMWLPNRRAVPVVSAPVLRFQAPAVRMPAPVIRLTPPPPYRPPLRMRAPVWMPPLLEQQELAPVALPEPEPPQTPDYAQPPSRTPSPPGREAQPAPPSTPPQEQPEIQELRHRRLLSPLRPMQLADIPIGEPDSPEPTRMMNHNPYRRDGESDETEDSEDEMFVMPLQMNELLGGEAEQWVEESEGEAHEQNNEQGGQEGVEEELEEERMDMENPIAPVQQVQRRIETVTVDMGGITRRIPVFDVSIPYESAIPFDPDNWEAGADPQEGTSQVVEASVEVKEESADETSELQDSPTSPPSNEDNTRGWMIPGSATRRRLQELQQMEDEGMLPPGLRRHMEQDHIQELCALSPSAASASEEEGDPRRICGVRTRGSRLRELLEQALKDSDDEDMPSPVKKNRKE